MVMELRAVTPEERRELSQSRENRGFILLPTEKPKSRLRKATLRIGTALLFALFLATLSGVASLLLSLGS